MAKTQVVKPLIAAMKRRRDCIHQAVEMVSKMYENSSPELITQVKELYGAGVLSYEQNDSDSPSNYIPHTGSRERSN